MKRCDNMIKKIDHFVITTADPNACISFYTALGFRVENEGDAYVLYADDFKINVHIKGQERLPHATQITCGSGDFCFEISNSLVAFQKELEKKGIVSDTGIVIRHGVKGRMHSFYVYDPDGNLIEFCNYNE